MAMFPDHDDEDDDLMDDRAAVQKSEYKDTIKTKRELQGDTWPLMRIIRAHKVLVK